MKCLVVGGLGNMGRRYCAILKYLGVEYDIFDTANPMMATAPNDNPVTHCIIATPIKEHVADILQGVVYIENILCEKPITKNIKDFKRLEKFKDHCDLRMVCNFAFAHPSQQYQPGCNLIDYNYYNTGKDGYWDYIQLIYLASQLTIKTTSPWFNVTIGMRPITLDMIAESYIRMIRTWLDKPEKLWGLEQAKAATEKVIAWEKDQKPDNVT